MKALFGRALAAALAAMCVLPAAGQEAVRMSLAGEAAAEARRSAALTPGFYNIRLGPSAWNISAGLDLEGNDNIRFEARNSEADLTVRPQLNSRMNLRISKENTLHFAIGAGYSTYLEHPELNRFFVAPGSEMALDFYAGDFWFNLHERLSITKNAYEDPTVFGIADYSQLQNSVGVSTTLDLNKVIVQLRYDHANYSELTGGGGVPDGESETASLSAIYRFGSRMEAGIESGGGVTRYNGANAGIQQATDWNVGTFVESQPMEHVHLRARAGYTVYSPDRVAAQGPADEFTGVYARLGLSHRLNKFMEYELNGGRNISFGFFAGTVDLYDVVLQVRWHVFQKVSVGTWLSFEHGSQVLIGNERFERFGPGLSMERSITRRMSGSIRYQYYHRQSDFPEGDYAVNILTVNLVYQL